MSFQPQILLFKGRGFLCDLIRWQTRGVYSHAAFLICPNEIIEAWPGTGLFLQGSGVRRKTITDFEGVDRFHHRNMSPLQWEVAIEYATWQLGKPYAYKGVLRFLTRQSDEDEPDKFFCSELVADSCARAGAPILNREPWAIAPDHLGWSRELLKITE